MGLSLKVKITVAKKFKKYLSDNMIMPDTRSKLQTLYMETFRPTLDDPTEKRVNFGALLFCLRTKLGFIEPTSSGDPQARETIVYSDGLAVVLRGLKEKLVDQREHLTRDKGNISISPPSVGGVIDMNTVYVKVQKEIVLSVENKSERTYFFGCVVLGSATDFNVNNSKYEFMGATRQISTGNECLKGLETIHIPVSICEENPGKFHVAVAFWFKSGKGKPFHILKFIKVDVVDDAVDSMKPESPYKKRKKTARHEPASRVVKGERIPLPKIKYRVRLGEYPVPDKLREAMKNDDAEFVLPTFWGSPAGDGRTSVKVHCKRLSTLLHVEELQMKFDIRNYDIERATFTPEKNGYLTLNVPGLTENRPSLVRNDRVFARKLLPPNDKPEGVEYEGFIHEIRLDEIYLKFDPMFHQTFIYNAQFAIRFTFVRTWLMLMHRALQSAGPYLEQIPFERRRHRETTVSTQPLRFYDRKVEANEEQKQAVENIVAGTSLPCPYLVFGPPGTGKTVTLVEAIKQVLRTYPQSKVLACAPSNSAADLILERIAQHSVIPKTQMIRLNAFSRQKSDVKPSIMEFCKMEKEVFYFPPREEIMHDYRLVVSTLISAGRLVSMGFGDSHFTHVFIDEAGQGMEPECFIPIAGLLKTTGSKVGQLVLAGDPKQLGPIIRSPLAMMKFTNAKDDFLPQESKLLTLREGDEIRLVDKEDIADGMLYGVVNDNEGYFPAKYATDIQDSPKAKYDYAPEGIAKLLSFKKGDVIRVLKQEQLAEGMVYGKVSGEEGYFPAKYVTDIEHGLDVSFLERLMSPQFPCYNRQPGTEPGEVGSYDGKMVTKLLNNYRSHPHIIKVPNECFYEGELRACADQVLRESLCHWKGLPNQGFPVIFEGVCGGDTRENTSPSFFNPEEAAIVLRYVRELKDARGLPLKTEEIGIISPYHKQVVKIRQCLQKKLRDVRDIKVGSVEEFQGQERKVIIISTVRSSTDFFHLDAAGKLGFVNNPKRFNVAVTRAKALLIVVGNPHVLSRDKNWRKLIGFCQENGSYKGCAFEMPEVDDVYFKRQLKQLGLDNEEAINKCSNVSTEADYEDQEWRPPQD